MTRRKTDPVQQFVLMLAAVGMAALAGLVALMRM